MESDIDLLSGEQLAKKNTFKKPNKFGAPKNSSNKNENLLSQEQHLSLKPHTITEE